MSSGDKKKFNKKNKNTHLVAGLIKDIKIEIGDMVIYDSKEEREKYKELYEVWEMLR